jgi:hypothetical protein
VLPRGEENWGLGSDIDTRRAAVRTILAIEAAAAAAVVVVAAAVVVVAVVVVAAVVAAAAVAVVLSISVRRGSVDRKSKNSRNPGKTKSTAQKQKPHSHTELPRNTDSFC